MFFLGCHLVDLVIGFMGMPKEIIPLNTCSGVEGVTADDQGFAVMKYDSGNSFVKAYATERFGFLRRQLVLSGTRGTVEINPLEIYGVRTPHDNHNTKIRISSERGGNDINSWHDIGEWKTIGLFDRYDNMMRSFAEMVRGEKVNPYTPDYELEVYKHVLKACGSEEIKL